MEITETAITLAEIVAMLEAETGVKIVGYGSASVADLKEAAAQ